MTQKYHYIYIGKDLRVEVFGEKYLLAMDNYIMVTPTHIVCREAPHEKLKINEMGSKSATIHTVLQSKRANFVVFKIFCYIQECPIL